jgi:hypothetical protein
MSPQQPQHLSYPQQKPEDITQWDNPFYTLAASFHDQKSPNPWRDHASEAISKHKFKPQSQNYLYSSFDNEKNHIDMEVPGFANRSITLCRESVRKHIWHLCPLKNP